MEGQGDGERERALLGVDNSAAEGDGDVDGDRGRYSVLVRCASQSSLDESSQRPAGGEGAPPPAHHAGKLLEALARLRVDGTLCDVRLQGTLDVAPPQVPPDESRAVAAHRAVLAAASPYFHAMFTQFDERTRPLITIQNVDPQALEAIIEYIYTPDSLVITEENVQALLSAASLVQASGVRDACCAFLARALCAENALGIRAFAELHACANLCAAAARYIDAHFLDVLDTEEFLALAPDTLALLLDSDRITVPNEEVILDAVIRWMRHEPETRQQHLGTLLEHVRLPLLAQDALVSRAAAEPLASAGLRVKDLVIEALSFHLMRPERRALAAASCVRARPRHPPASPKMLLVVGGQAPKAIRDVEAYHMECGRWRPCAELLTRRCRAGLAVVHGKVYAVGGFNARSVHRQARCASALWTCTTSRRTRGRPGRRCVRAARPSAWPSSAAWCTRWAVSTAPPGLAPRRRWTRARACGDRSHPCRRVARRSAWPCSAGDCTRSEGTTVPRGSACTRWSGTSRRRTRGSRWRRCLRAGRGVAWAWRRARCTRWAATTDPRCAAPWRGTGRSAAGRPPLPCTPHDATPPSRTTPGNCTSSAETTAPPTSTRSRCSTRRRTRGRCCRRRCLWAARTRAWR